MELNDPVNEFFSKAKVIKTFTQKEIVEINERFNKAAEESKREFNYRNALSIYLAQRTFIN
jgi:hypothetical protein